MAVETGKLSKIDANDGAGGGVFTTLVECGGWTCNSSVEVKRYVSCQTNGETRKRAGPTDNNGTFTGFTDVLNHIRTQIVPDGREYIFRLYYTATNYHEVAAIVTALNDEASAETQDIQKWTINWEQSGAITFNN